MQTAYASVHAFWLSKFFLESVIPHEESSPDGLIIDVSDRRFFGIKDFGTQGASHILAPQIEMVDKVPNIFLSHVSAFNARRFGACLPYARSPGVVP
jgi:hypothetical protein